MWVLFLVANKYACYYKFAMVIGEGYNIVSLSEKLKKQILKSCLCYESGAWLVFVFFFFCFFFFLLSQDLLKKTAEKKLEWKIPCHIIRRGVFMHFYQGSQKVTMTYLGQTIWRKKAWISSHMHQNNKHFSLWWYKPKQVS